MRYISAVGLLVVFLLSGGGLSLSSGQMTETESQKQTTVALDLLDLEIPGEGDGDQMDLPPIQETERPAENAEPAAPQPEPPGAEFSRTEIPEAGRSAPSPMPGMAPFLLEEGGAGLGGRTRATTQPTEGTDSETLLQEVPAELKTVPPPPSRAENLKLPSELDGGPSGEEMVPEIPLLRDDEGGEPSPVPGGQDSTLTMKPFTESGEVSRAGRRGAGPLREGRRPEDYLQVREEIDSRLIEIYERHYKDR